MLTPDYLDTVADPIIEIFSKLQEEILADIVRRIVKTNYITPTAEWQAMKLQESGMLLRDIQKYIQNTLGLTDAELKELFEQATIENLSGHYTTADIIRLLKRDTTIYQTILSGLEKTNGHLKNMTMTTANAYQQLFIESLDDAYWKVNSGAFDYNSAIVEATDTMLKKGQTVVEYPSGHMDAVDVAVRRAILTGINQTQGQVQMDLAEEFDLDYVDVTAHLGARPSHAVWQGKRYCISGKDPDFPKFADATGYGTGEGICGWNCRHSFSATTKNANFAFSEEELEELKNKTVTYNGQTLSYYDATQVQRKYERTCRKLRRDLVAIDELPDSPEKQALFERKSANLKAREAQYRDFSHQTGLLTQSERMRVYQYNRELSRKVGKASKEYLEGHKGIEPFKAVSTPKPKVVAKTPKTRTWRDIPFSMSYNADDYVGTEMRDKLGRTFTQNALDIVKNSPEEYQRIFAHYVPSMGVGSTSEGDQAWWSPSEKKYFLGARYVAKGDSISKPYQTFFHETGHGIDTLANEMIYGVSRHISSNYGNGLFGQTLADEIKEKMLDYCRSVGAEGRSEDYQHFIWSNYIVKTYPEIAYADFSDMVQGVFPDCTNWMGIGHKTSYYAPWNRLAFENRCTEAFAEITDSILANPESLNFLKSYIPKTMDVYWEIIEEILNKGVYGGQV